MAKSVNAGELRTSIEIQEHTETTTPNGFSQKTWRNVRADGRRYRCKWVNAHGREALEAKQLGLTEPATLTMRYTPKLTPECRILRGNDPSPYEVISIDNVENQNRFLEVKVQRKVTAK